MLKSYIKKIVKTELTKQKLNNIYGSKMIYDTNIDSSKELLSDLNEVIHHQNTELSNLYNTISSLKQENKELKEENEKLKIYLKKSNDYVKSLEQENKELLSKDCATNGIHIVQLEDANSKIETIGNMVEKLVNESQDLKQENQKLKDKIYNIKGIIHVQHKRTYTNDNLTRTIKLIENILKES